MAVSKSQRTKEMSSKNSVTCDLPPEHAISTDHATTWVEFISKDIFMLLFIGVVLVDPNGDV